MHALHLDYCECISLQLHAHVELLSISTPDVCMAGPHADSVVVGIILLSAVLLSLTTAMTTGCCITNKKLILKKTEAAVPS